MDPSKLDEGGGWVVESVEQTVSFQRGSTRPRCHTLKNTNPTYNSVLAVYTSSFEAMPPIDMCQGRARGHSRRHVVRTQLSRALSVCFCLDTVMTAKAVDLALGHAHAYGGLG